jgi:hypothetical protein
MANNNLAPRDIKRHQTYNAILGACMVKPCSVYALNSALGVHVHVARSYAADLIAFGLLSAERIDGREKSNLSRRITYYIALAATCPMELIHADYRRIVVALAPPPAKAHVPGHRLISFETDRNLQAKYSATSKMTREQRGFKKAYVSGSILSNAL